MLAPERVEQADITQWWRWAGVMQVSQQYEPASNLANVCLSDNGHWRSDAYKWTLQTGQYSGGRSSDGPVYTEYLSSLVGPKANQSAILFDYAYSGASTNNSVTTYSIPDMPQQVSTYLGDLAGGNATIAATAGKKTLITVWAGMCYSIRQS